MSDARSIVTAAEIEVTEGTAKTHFKNEGARRANISLGELTGLTRLGFHIVAVQPGFESTEYHVHHHEEECTYVMAGTGQVVIGEETRAIGPGDFIGDRAGGLAHTIKATGSEVLRCIVVGQRLDYDALQELGGAVGKK